MGLHRTDLPADIARIVREGSVIPAHPLALTEDRRLDERRQRALTRYYLDAGAGGLAIGVHTTQFAIRECGLYEPVLKVGAETVQAWTTRPIALIAGLCGNTAQACREADIAVEHGFHAGLLSLAAMHGVNEDHLIAHCQAVASRMPLFGFYLQPAVGGIVLPTSFWRRFAEIDNVIGIKVAPFNRYKTLDVIRGVALARAEHRIALYTGNDDHIVLDMLLPFRIRRDDEVITLRFAGGLLGHWCVWTRSAVDIHRRCCAAAVADAVPSDLLALDAAVTDCNGAFFDVANGYAGCIAGCHEVLRAQGLLEGPWLLDPHEKLSPGQREEIARVRGEYAALADDDFVAENLARWLA